jgi:hypothetical protein
MSGAKLNRTVLVDLRTDIDPHGNFRLLNTRAIHAHERGCSLQYVSYRIRRDRTVHCFNWRDAVSSFLQYRVWPYRSLQAVASFFGLSPIQYFHWTSIDDLLHVTLGVTLILIGCYALRNPKRRNKL